MKVIRLREGKERSLLRKHPWVFESGIAKGGGDAGETVRVESSTGAFLAWASFSPRSNIRLRAWSFEEAERIDAAFFDRRCAAAVAARRRMAIDSDAWRVVHGESDGLPGVIADLYGETLVVQFLSCGAERWKSVLADALLRHTGASALYERSDASSRQLEGLPELTGWLSGGAEGRPTEIELRESGWRLSADIALGHKTGYYLDQRDNRRSFRDTVQRLRLSSVLNCFSYTGGFSVAALAGGAEQVISVDSSGPALARARDNVLRNGFELARTEFWDADVNSSLRRLLKEGRRFDAIVLDPPKLAPTVAHAERAARAYKDLNRLGLSLLETGGVLFTFSCSGGISADLFHKIVASAGADAQVDGFITERMGGAPDHPMTLAFPEGEYLKGLVVMRR